VEHALTQHQHWRYFQLLGFDRKQRNAYVSSRKWQYMWYGAAYLFMQLVPPFSMFFLLTAAVSSALWAADLEKAKMEQEQAAQTPSYTDDPDDTV
jgi:hypothetical protein